MILNRLDVVIPGGWVYTEPSTGLEIRGGDFWNLRGKVLAHKLNNGIPTGPQLDEEIQQVMCAAMPDHVRKEWCREETEPPTEDQRHLHLSDLKSFFSVAKGWLLDRPSFVPQAEAERRAAICSVCPKNVEVKGCSACYSLALAVTGLVGNRRTFLDDHLKACAVCGCSNQAQVHLPESALVKGMSPLQDWPTICWKKNFLVKNAL